MIISVEDAKKLVDFNGWPDEKIERKLKAVEAAIRSYTNNNFQKRTYRMTADIVGGLFYVDSQVLFKVDDTIQISESKLNEGLYTVIDVTDLTFSVKEETEAESNVLVTKVEYPADVVDVAINLLEWEVKYRDKIGIQSETLSRHSVSYVSQDANNQINGYPVALMGGLRPYRKARF